MIRNPRAKVWGAWANSDSRAFVAALVEVASWKRVALVLALTLFNSATRGAQVLLLVPLMQLVGLQTQEGAVGWLDEIVSAPFAFLDVRPTLVTVLVAFMIFTTAQALVLRWQAVYSLKLEQGFVAALRQRLYQAIAGANWLAYARRRSSDFAHALTNELERVGNASFYLLTLTTEAVMLAVYVLLALRLSAAMTALAFGSGMVLLLLLRKKRQAAQLSGEEISLSTNGLYAAAIEHLGGMKTVKSYGAERRSAGLFSGLAEWVARMRLDAVRNNAGASFWFSVGSMFILSLILYVSFEVLSLPVAGLLLLLFLFSRIVPLFSEAQDIYQQYLNDLPAFAGVSRMLARCEADAEPQVEHPKEVKLWHGVRLEKVSFAYAEENVPTLANLDLTIKAGETTAIVGPSGAGKSTVADLVMGLISPDLGRVLVGEAPLDAERMRSWREQVGYVAQDTFLFNDTIRANLLWARPDADEREIEEALKLAAAEFVFGLPDGLDTLLGDRGVRLSGGERQRLALARALLRRPSLLILDEATSALDSENERRIQDAVEELRGCMTILVITHRLTTVREADVIYVLDQGTVAELGGWETLISREDGRFNALCQAQGLKSG